MPRRGRRTRGRAAAPPPPAEEHDSSDDDIHNNDAPAPAADGEQQPEEDHAGNIINNGSNDDTPAGGEKEEEDSVFKILLSSDNHLGYNERDPIRGGDSFAAFEEVLSLARRHKADMVLLSGNLFHDNKPSRKTLHTTMEILRRYCMGGEPVRFQIVSDQKECLRSVVSGRANFEDEFYSVDLPIFTIHGNHDNPTGDGGPDHLSAVDLLSVSNLVNYFGRQDGIDDVKVSPVLLQKGQTKVALYGMGSMGDKRLNRMWQGKKLKFLRPDQNQSGEGEDEEYGESHWMNIFTLHQNRDSGLGSKNCVHETMIPEWMDLVVWGHEHESMILPQESLAGTFRISQPGSSVATSLTVGESRRKQVGLLEIKGQQFRIKPIPLRSVRSFSVGEVSLSKKAREGGVLDVEDPKVEERMSEVLTAEVEALIENARDKAESLAEAKELARQTKDEFDTNRRERKYKIKDPEKVLVRLMVEHTGFATLNNQRFGAQFVDKANPFDLLLFHQRRQAKSVKGAIIKKHDAGLGVPVEPEDLADVDIEDLVNENLVNNDTKLELLDEKSMREALEQFVNKMDSRAFANQAANIILKKRAKHMPKSNTNDTAPASGGRLSNTGEEARHDVDDNASFDSSMPSLEPMHDESDDGFPFAPSNNHGFHLLPSCTCESGGKTPLPGFHELLQAAINHKDCPKEISVILNGMIEGEKLVFRDDTDEITCNGSDEDESPGSSGLRGLGCDIDDNSDASTGSSVASLVPMDDENDDRVSTASGGGRGSNDSGGGSEVISSQHGNLIGADRKVRVHQQQQRLLLLHHSSKCPFDDGKCKVTPYCSETKKLSKHMAECKDIECQVPNCLSSRALLRHYRKCKALCSVCGPVWEIVRKTQNNPTGNDNTSGVVPSQQLQHQREKTNGTQHSISQGTSVHTSSSSLSQQQGESSSLSSGKPHQFRLTPTGKVDLKKAILSALYHPDGEVDPGCLQRAMAHGLPKQSILNAAVVARKRDQNNREQRQLQQQQQ